MITVLITGNILSGKTYISELLKDMNYHVIHADLISYNELCINKKLFSNLFGRELYIGRTVDRHYLINNIFSDIEKYRLFNKTLIPLIKESIADFIEFSSNEDIIFVEWATAFELGIENEFDKILLVTANEETRLARASSRKYLSIEDIKKIMSLQVSDDKKVTFSDYVIYNNNKSDIKLTIELNNIIEQIQGK